MKFKTKPVELEAIQWTGENRSEIERAFMHEDRILFIDGILWIQEISFNTLRKEQVNIGDYVFYDERQQLCRLPLHGIVSKYNLPVAFVDAGEEPEDITEVE